MWLPELSSLHTSPFPPNKEEGLLGVVLTHTSLWKNCLQTGSGPSDNADFYFSFLSLSSHIVPIKRENLQRNYNQGKMLNVYGLN